MRSQKVLRPFIIIIVIALSGFAMFFDKDLLTHKTGAPITGNSFNSASSNMGSSTGMKKTVEGHWQGMEVVQLTWELAAKLRIPLSEKGVLIDEVTLAAAKSGLYAKDIVKSIDGVSITTLGDFLQVTKRVRNKNHARIEVKRGNENMAFDLMVPDILGFAQMESAPMVLAGSIPPHRHRGPCTNCHAIGNTGDIQPDPGLITLAPPPISKKTKSPHRFRGKCKLCHILR